MKIHDMKKIVIDADNLRKIEEFEETETQEVFERYKTDGRWEDVSIDIAGDIILWEELYSSLENIFPEHDYKCPYCGYEMLDGEEEDCGDCGCPSCRHIIDWEDFN